jgi:hypothetical protein
VAIENFTTFQHDDEDNKITTTASLCSFANALTRTRTYRIYKDYGASHFQDFTHKIDVQITTIAPNDNPYYWIASQGIGDANELKVANDLGFGISSYKNVDIFIWDLLDVGMDGFVGTAGTTFYLTVSRSGTTGTALVYSDSARTNLLDTISITVSNAALRYIYCFAGWDSSGDDGGSCTGFSQNFDLQEAAGLSIPVVMADYRQRRN